jgi:hypothetical protein
VIHLAGIGESVVDAAIGDLEKLSNPTVGLLAHPGIVDVRITAKADSISAADLMIAEIEKQIITAFPNKIFGYDSDTLLNSVINLAKSKSSTISITCFGLDENWPPDLFASFQNTLLLQKLIQPHNPLQIKYDHNCSAPLQADCSFAQLDGESKMEFNLITKEKSQHFSNLYNGPSAQGPTWAVNIFLETLRQTLIILE